MSQRSIGVLGLGGKAGIYGIGIRGIKKGRGRLRVSLLNLLAYILQLSYYIFRNMC
jgi:hypothetical protein